MAVNFITGSSQFLNLGIDLNVCRNVAGMTMMAWVRAAETTGAIPGGAVRQIGGLAIGPPPVTSTQSRLSLEHMNTGVRLAARALDLDAASFFDVGSLTAGLWTHVAGVADCANTEGYLYLNGVLISQQNFTSMTAGNTSDTNSKNAAVGAEDDGSVKFFNGSLEDFRVYNRALGPAEIQTIFASLGRDYILQDLAWKFLMNEGGDGTNVVACPSIGSERVVAAPSGGPLYVGGVAAAVRRKSYFQAP